ncbi:MAG: hypothetical protein LBR07_06290, partial [Puniceicoccales bacterium]|nr:hypothetical protein [Puniceicoccales bacterium]
DFQVGSEEMRRSRHSKKEKQGGFKGSKAAIAAPSASRIETRRYMLWRSMYVVRHVCGGLAGGVMGAPTFKSAWGRCGVAATFLREARRL